MKKHHSIALLFIGAALFCISVVLAIISTTNKNIIGGADWSTFYFVFFHENRGLYSTLAFVGMLFVIISIVFIKTRKK